MTPGDGYHNYETPSIEKLCLNRPIENVNSPWFNFYNSQFHQIMNTSYIKIGFPTYISRDQSNLLITKV